MQDVVRWPRRRPPPAEPPPRDSRPENGAVRSGNERQLALRSYRMELGKERSANTPQADQRSAEDMSRLAAIVRHSSELIALADSDGSMLFINEAGATMLG